ncbi:MAG: MBL fold metallo-hydrolase, partial [Bacteroidota bacterium]
MNRREFLKVAELGFFGALFDRGPTGVFQSAKQSSSPVPSHHLENGFRNVDPNFKEGDIDFIDFLRFLGRRIGGTPPSELPLVTKPDFAFLNQNRTKNTITWVGHSTLLIQMEGLNILSDPVWASRVGPMNFVGSRRWTEPAMRIDQLPELDAVIISHNHYDHFDMDAVKAIQAHNPSVVMV